jgi:hypothetical protein
MRSAGVMYAKAFFDLQLRFADRVATLSGLPLSRVLLEYTNLYIRFGLGRAFNASDQTWQAYLAGLEGPARIAGLDRCFPFQALSVEAPGVS